MTHTLVAAALVLACATTASAQTIDIATLDRLFDRLLEKNKGMGGVTLARDGAVIYSRSFGYRQIADTHRLPLAADTKYRIASITKTYTAVMVLQLVEERRLKLTDTLDGFFPQIPNASRITIAQLLHHRSGIPGIEQDGRFGRQTRTQGEIIARIAQGKPNFEPDTQSSYANTGYIVLGFIVEKIDGKPYGDALRDRITSRLGLKDTYAGLGNTDPERNEALSYRYIGGWRQSDELDFSVVAGAGGIVSTTADMAAFIQGLFDLKLISKDSLAQMQTMRDGEGMGLERHTFAGKTCYGHTGGSGSSGAWLTYCPDEKLTLAYATNAKIYPVRHIVAGVFDVYWNRPFEVPAFDAFDVSADVLDRYVGVYVIAGTPARMVVVRDGGTLFIQPPGQPAVPLEAMAENKFRIDPMPEFEFDPGKGLMTVTRGGQQRVFTREK